MLYFGQVGSSWGHRAFFGSSWGEKVITPKILDRPYELNNDMIILLQHILYLYCIHDHFVKTVNYKFTLLHVIYILN
jgi:hypothetical protein